MYKVIAFFTDLQDGNHPYNAGDDFPREGLEVSDERIAELSSANNKRHRILIKEVPDEKPAEKEPDEKPSKPAAKTAKEGKDGRNNTVPAKGGSRKKK